MTNPLTEPTAKRPAPPPLVACCSVCGQSVDYDDDGNWYCDDCSTYWFQSLPLCGGEWYDPTAEQCGAASPYDPSVGVGSCQLTKGHRGSHAADGRTWWPNVSKVTP